MDINNFPLWTALVTPFKENLDIDFNALKGLMSQQEKAQNGILLLGSTGEGLNLNLEEKKEVIKFGTAQKGSSPIMAGVGGINLPATLEWIDFLNCQEVDTYLLVNPLYAKPGAKGQINWFKQLLDRAQKRCMLYNIPSRSGIEIFPEVIEALKDHPNLWALKEASGSVEKFKAFSNISSNLRVYSGDDELLVDFAPHRCQGLVSVASNAWPLAANRYTKMALDGKTEELKVWKEIARSLFCASNPVPVKYMMAQLNMIPNGLVRAPLSTEDLTDPTPLTKANELVNQWIDQY